MTYRPEGLNRNGSFTMRARSVEGDSLETGSWPDHGYAVLCGADQVSPVARERLGHVLQIWSLPVEKVRIQSGGHSKRLRLTDAAGSVLANHPLTVELKKRSSKENLFVDGWRSDADGMVQTPDVRGAYYFTAFWFEHPDYGSARMDRHALTLHGDKDIVVPLLKSGAKE
jgi:hypothetical protein